MEYIDLSQQLTVLLATFVATFFSSLAGGGAGLVLLPALLLLGIPYIKALTLNKIGSTLMGIGSATRYKKEKLINKPVFYWTVLMGAPFVLLGVYLATNAPEQLMKKILGIAILILIAFTLIKKPLSRGNHHYKKLNLKRGLIGGLFLAPMAVFSGAIGGGIGIGTTFLFIYQFQYSQIRAIAMTMSANGIFWNGIGMIALISLGHTHWELVPPVIIGSIFGSYLGAHIGIKIGNQWVRILFLIIASIIAILLLKPQAIHIN